MRYFKSTNGEVTIFRGTQGRYQFGRFSGKEFGFSNVPGLDRAPAVEITRAEYQKLMALKVARLDAESPGRQWSGNAPQDSWVRNSAIVGEG